MIVTIVNVWVKSEFREEFIKATIENHKNSIKEPGNLRFDFLQSKEDPNYFVLYEAYDSEESAKAHKETKHYKNGKKQLNLLWPNQGKVYLFQ
ncbi:MAG: putative quinol monooxygenase [Brevinematia bacterium]